MSKYQKFWLWVFIAMFAIPEILWSPVGNFLFAFIQNSNSPSPLRDNFLLNPDYANFFSAVLGIQAVGILLILIYVLLYHRLIKSTLVLLGLILLLSVAFLVVFFLCGISISLRHIGF